MSNSIMWGIHGIAFGNSGAEAAYRWGAVPLYGSLVIGTWRIDSLDGRLDAGSQAREGCQPLTA